MLLTYQESVSQGVISFTADQSLQITTEAAQSLSLEAGDFDGDGLEDFAIGLGFDSEARVLFVENDEGTLALGSNLIASPARHARSARSASKR